MRDFGTELYFKYYQKFNCRLPNSEIEHFLHQAHVNYLTSSDICREALVSLMVGRKFQSPLEENFYKWFMQCNVDH